MVAIGSNAAIRFVAKTPNVLNLYFNFWYQVHERSSLLRKWLIRLNVYMQCEGFQ